MKIIKKSSIIFVALCLLCLNAAASVTLSWLAPTTRANGSALPAAEIAGYTVTRNGVALGTVTALSYIDAAATGCNTQDVYGVFVTDTGGLSGASSTTSLVIDKVNCAPGSPTGLKVSGGK